MTGNAAMLAGALMASGWGVVQTQDDDGSGYVVLEVSPPAFPASLLSAPKPFEVTVIQ